MATKKFLLSIGQSNASPTGTYSDWLAYHPELNMALSTTKSIGSYPDKHVMPGSFTGYGTLDLKGVAVKGLRYLTFYNPLASGYSTYPCTGKVRTGTTSNLNLVVDQTFEAAAVTGNIILTRARDGSQHQIVGCTPNAAGATLRVVPFSIGIVTTDTVNEILTLSSTHGWITNTLISFVAASGGSIPGGLVEGTPYYVINPSGATLQVSATAGGTPINLNAVHTGTVYVHLSSKVWNSPVVGEQFTYNIAGVTGTSTIVLPLGFGKIQNGTLLGMKITGVTGANAGVSKIVTAWNNSTREALLDSAFGAISTTDTFTITPPTGTFEKWGYWLPWSQYEAGATSGKTNPYPPGFNYPNHYHNPISYNPFAANGSGGSISIGIAYHVGLGIRLRELYGQEFYVHACDFGGTTLAHNETDSGSTVDIGWWDPNQQTSWMPGESNNCFARLQAELEASKVAAAADGDTLECVGVCYLQGESDASISAVAARYGTNSREFRSIVRNLLVSMGFWTKSPDLIPWVHPEISGSDALPGQAWAYADTVNAQIRLYVEEDKCSRTFSVADLTRKVGDNAHYTGESMFKLEQRCYEALLDIRRTTDQTGEVDICNMALANIGDSALITSIDPVDGTPQSTHCARFYPVARDAVLEMGQWAFAMKRRTLVETTSPTTAWQYAYILPGDCLKAVTIQADDSAADYLIPNVMSTTPAWPSLGSAETVPQAFAIEYSSDGTRIILTNQEDAVLRYVGRVYDTRRYPASFKQAVSWKLAAMLSGPIIKGEEGSKLAVRAEQMARAMCGQASVSDAAQRKIPFAERNPWNR